MHAGQLVAVSLKGWGAGRFSGSVEIQGSQEEKERTLVAEVSEEVMVGLLKKQQL